MGGVRSERKPASRSSIPAGLYRTPACQVASPREAPDDYPPVVRRWYVWLPISAGLLILLIWRTRPWDAAALLSGADLGPVLLAVGLNALVVILWAERSRSLMAAVGSPLGLGTLVPVVAFANTVNNLTPASSGEVLRALVLKRRYAVAYADSTAVILAERLWAIGLMAVSAGAAALGTIIPASSEVVIAAWLAAALLAFIPTLAYRIGLSPGGALLGLADRLGSEWLMRIAGRLAEVDARLAQIVRSPTRSLHFVLTTAAIFVIFTAQLDLVLQALGVDLPPGGVWAATGLAICAGVLSALPFGLGAADAVLVLLLVAQGAEVAAASAAAIMLRSVATLPLGLVGTASWLQLWRAAPGEPPASPPSAIRGPEE
jgi:uncharacterized protein (TIRG00374 family)